MTNSMWQLGEEIEDTRRSLDHDEKLYPSEPAKVYGHDTSTLLVIHNEANFELCNMAASGNLAAQHQMHILGAFLEETNLNKTTKHIYHERDKEPVAGEPDWDWLDSALDDWPEY